MLWNISFKYQPPKIRQPMTQPTAPSKVFLGLTSGQSLCLPSFFPNNQANVSTEKLIKIRAHKSLIHWSARMILDKVNKGMITMSTASKGNFFSILTTRLDSIFTKNK